MTRIDGRGEQRRWGKAPRNKEARTEYQRDRDRLLYSTAFSRLSGVTQVSAVGEHRVLHNRHTHSLKVASIGRRLAERLIHGSFGDPALIDVGVDPDIVETAGLAHDLGHPPFGHVAEVVLHRRLAEVDHLDGFEGNAQSFRIVTKLARHKSEFSGLDLTRASLNALMKYPRLYKEAPAGGAAEDTFGWTDRSRGTKWGVYTTEDRYFRWVRENGSEDDQKRDVCAIITDWSDDISYATHDIEDYFRAGLIPMHDLDIGALAAHGVSRLSGRKDFDPSRFTQALNTIRPEKISAPYRGTSRDRCQLHDYTSGQLDYFMTAAHVSAGIPYVQIDGEAQYRAEALMELTWYYVIDSPALAMMQEGQVRLIESLYDNLYKWLTREPASSRLPVSLRELYKDIEKDPDGQQLMDHRPARCARTVSDYICSLTENQAVDIYERMTGTSRGSIFGAWFN